LNQVCIWHSHDAHQNSAPSFFETRELRLVKLFGNFRLTIQNTTNRHVSNAFGLIAVFISFSLARAAAAVAVAADFLLLGAPIFQRCCVKA
jgi:hypothetical protein